MQTAIFRGISDDGVYITGVKGGDEFGVKYDGQVRASFLLGGLMRIYAIYDGCWSFSVSKVDEDIDLPDWPIRLHDYGNHSVYLEIDVPDDVKVFYEG